MLLGSLNTEIFVRYREEPKTFPEFKKVGWTRGICSAPRGSRDKLPSLDPDPRFQNKQTKVFRMFQIMCILCYGRTFASLISLSQLGQHPRRFSCCTTGRAAAQVSAPEARRGASKRMVAGISGFSLVDYTFGDCHRLDKQSILQHSVAF